MGTLSRVSLDSHLTYRNNKRNLLKNGEKEINLYYVKLIMLVF